MIGFISSPRFVAHETGPWHPERPDRLRAVHRALRLAGLVGSPDPFPDFELSLGPLERAVFKLLEIAPQPAGDPWLLEVHSAHHLSRIAHICERGGGVLDQGDTPVGADSNELAKLSVGAVLTACDAVMNGSVQRAFVASRPPGHHAEPDRAMGFCLYSNIAIGARYLQKQFDVQRVAIVDFDVHHGNGTQVAFEADPSVFFVSMHQHPRTCYPGSGYDWEIGVGAGRGYTMNVPFMPGSGDPEYLEALRERVLPALDRFNPEVLLISAGFDAHIEDPLASIDLSEEGFEQITRELVRLADRRCAGRVVSVLEGGYHLRALGRSVVRHVTALAEGMEFNVDSSANPAAQYPVTDPRP